MQTILCFFLAWFCIEPIPRLSHQDNFLNQTGFELRPQTIMDLHHYRHYINDELMGTIISVLYSMWQLDFSCSKQAVHYFSWHYITITCHEREMVRQLLSRTLHIKQKRWGQGPFDESWYFCDRSPEEIVPPNRGQEFNTTEACPDGGNRMWYLHRKNPNKTELAMLKDLLQRTMESVYN